MSKLHVYLDESKGHQPKPIDRSCFLYMEPRKGTYKPEEFAQCSSCMMWSDEKRSVCVIHGKDVHVGGSYSCALYVNGKPMSENYAHAKPYVTPKESGLVDTPVRCENCRYGNPHKMACMLFEKLNHRFPHFNLDAKIKPNGCCNAFMSKNYEAG